MICLRSTTQPKKKQQIHQSRWVKSYQCNSRFLHNPPGSPGFSSSFGPQVLTNAVVFCSNSSRIASSRVAAAVSWSSWYVFFAKSRLFGVGRKLMYAKMWRKNCMVKDANTYIKVLYHVDDACIFCLRSFWNYLFCPNLMCSSNQNAFNLYSCVYLYVCLGSRAWIKIHQNYSTFIKSAYLRGSTLQTNRHHAFRRLPQKAPFHISPTVIRTCARVKTSKPL